MRRRRARARLGGGTVAVFVLALDCALAVSGAAQPAGAQETPEVGSVLDIPHPALERVDPAVRAQLEAARDDLDARFARDPTAPGTAAALGQLGRLYLTYDLLIAAERCLIAVRALEPKSAEWPYLLGYLYQRMGNLDEAMAALEDGLAKDPENAAALLRVGTMHLDAGARGEARSAFERALTADPTCTAARYSLGELARRTGDYQTALEQFHLALEQLPEATQVHYGLGLTYRRLGKADEAIKHLERTDFRQVSLGKWWGCRDPLITAMGELSTGSAVHLARGAQAAFTGATEVELEEYRMAVAANPADAVARESLGAALYRAGDLTAAREHFAEAVRLDPDNPFSRHDLGQVLLSQGDTEAAMEQFLAAVEIDPAFQKARLQLAIHYQARNEFHAALDQLQRVVEIDPQNVEVRVQLAGALLRLGRRQEALAELGRLLDDHPPEDPEERLRMAAMVATLGDLARAERHFFAVLELDPPAPVKAQAHLLIGQAHLARGQLAAAIESFRTALALDPSLEAARSALNRALERSRAEAGDPPP